VAFLHDVRYSVRALARTPGFTAALIVSAAIGIGANAVVFGFIGNLVDPSTVMPGVVDDGWQGKLATIRGLLLFVSIFVFVISGASVIGLLLSRGAARVHETAVRVALGAQGSQLFRPLVAEGLVVGIAATAFGLLTAFWTIRGLPALFYDADVEAIPFSVDWPGLLIATLSGTLVVAGGALAPLIWTSRNRPAPDSRGTGPGLANTFGRWRSSLVRVQLALCAILLVSTSAVGKQLNAALRTDYAEQTGDAIVVRLDKVLRLQSFLSALPESLQDLPVGLTLVMPGGRVQTMTYRPTDDTSGMNLFELGTNIIGSGNLDLSGLVLVSGRTFQATDTAKSRRVALVNEAAVPLLNTVRANVLGMTLMNAGGRTGEIVGIVREVPLRTLQRRSGPMIYLPYYQQFSPSLSIVIGTRTAPSQELLASVAANLDPVKDGKFLGVTTLQTHLAQTATAADRLISGVVQVFAALATLLSFIGVIGVTSDAVARRTPEIALRLALGAPRWRIVGGVMRYGTGLAVIGVTAGLLLCFVGFLFVEPRLDGSRGPEPIIWFAAPIVLLVTMAAGTLLPARRALAVDPARLLRD
jgi:ABC-type antimicrobial peptide transport system permease subunit